MAAADDYKGLCLRNGVGGIPVVYCFVRGSFPKRYTDIDYRSYDSDGIQPPRGELSHCRPGMNYDAPIELDSSTDPLPAKEDG